MSTLQDKTTMLDGSLDLFTILMLAVAVVIFIRLRSVLGRKTGSERPPFEPYRRPGAPAGQTAPAEVGAGMSRRAEDGAGAQARASAEDRVGEVALADDRTRTGLLAIANADPTFDTGSFVKGARMAYEMIVTEFAAGNRKALKPLLSPEVYDGFASAIADRESRGEKVETKFVGINQADIVEAELKNKSAQVTVKFLSQLITATRSGTGDVIDGDPKKVRDLIDIWTFARDVPSANPNWRLVATQQAV